MGVPRPHAPHSHVFVRLQGAVDVVGATAVACAVQCQHEDFATGGAVTEALASGPDARAAVERAFPLALQVVDVRCPSWVEQSILGVGERGEPALAVVHALRAPEEEWDLVTHPHALSGSTLVRDFASRLASHMFA